MKTLRGLLALLYATTVFAGAEVSYIEHLNDENFGDKIGQDISIVEFWASWNQENELEDLHKVQNATVFKVDIDANRKLKKKYKVRAVPTVIIFNHGEEIRRFKANVMFELDEDADDVQDVVNEIIKNKFAAGDEDEEMSEEELRRSRF